MEKSTFVGTVGSNTLCQKTWEESRPHMCWIIGRETLVPAGDLDVDCEPAPAPLWYSLGGPWRTLT